jgi:hypothetical protein
MRKVAFCLRASLRLFFLRLPASSAARMMVVLSFLLMLTAPLAAQTTNAAPATTPAAASGDFGQYVADHQDDLSPFFTEHAGELFKLAVPLLMGMMGWVVLVTMLVGWGIDILLSRGFAFFFAPAFAEWKRSIIYATGELFLGFVYACLMGLVVVFCLRLDHALIIIGSLIVILMMVALAAQVVWVLYLYRTPFTLSTAFYLVVIIVQAITGLLIAGPVFGAHAPAEITTFVDAAITPRLRVEVEGAQRDLAAAKTERAGVRAHTSELKSQVAQARTEKEQLGQQIEEKKNSDVYIFAQIIKVRAGGDLTSAREQLTAFPAKFPNSPLLALARSQLADINTQMASDNAEQKQAEADAARATAAGRADLLARAAKGEVTLSEMRQAIIGKSRIDVKSLLGAPSQTQSDTWIYYPLMIINPLTNEKSGLIVNFSEGAVLGVDYNHNAPVGGIPGTQ